MATLAQIHDLAKQAEFFTWLENIIDKKKVKDNVFIQHAHSLLSADEERTRKNLLKDFHSRMSLFSDPLVRKATSHNTFDLKKLRKEKMSVYIHIPDSDKERLKSLLTLFWVQVIYLMTEKEPNLQDEPVPVLALLDEFGNMAKINKLKEGMSFLRSYRVRVIVMVQYLSQIYETYGQHGAKGFLNTKVKVAYALTDYEDAVYFSKLLGQRQVKVYSKSRSHGQHESVSRNETYQYKPLLSPEQIRQLKPREQLIVLESFPPIKARKRYYFEIKSYHAALQQKTTQRLNYALNILKFLAQKGDAKK